MSGAVGPGPAPASPAEGPTGMFSNPLFNSAPQAQAMPQYVAQPSSDGPSSGFNAMFKPSAPYSTTQAVPDWAKSQAVSPQQFVAPSSWDQIQRQGHK